MGVQADIWEEVRKEMVTKIHGQPTNQDLTILKKELIAILANIPTTLGGGNHGHAGIIVEKARYLLMMGVILPNPANPGTYPANVPGNAVAGVQARVDLPESTKLSKVTSIQPKISSSKQSIINTYSKLKTKFLDSLTKPQMTCGPISKTKEVHWTLQTLKHC
jgi:hypothetical protein